MIDLQSVSHYWDIIRHMNLQEIRASIDQLILTPVVQRISNKQLEYRSELSRHYKADRGLNTLFTETDGLFDYNGCPQTDAIPRKILRDFCEKYVEHRFDLLGSGWVYNRFKDEAEGVEGNTYTSLVLDHNVERKWLSDVVHPTDLKYSDRIYRLITPDYIPIDWQKDFKSGYRWSACDYSLPVKYIDAAVTPGVDIKVPWELGRLQHLTRMSYLYGVLDECDLFRETLAREFHDQLLDFIAQNPPLRGVNWACTMDVGIRTANIALSYSIMRAAGWIPPEGEEFERILTNTVYQHCCFIRHHLEWSYTCRSNHYLSDICGLLFGAVALPDSLIRSKWIRFASSEIMTEFRLQFHDDGTDFEASIGYHRLSSELVVYSLALIHQLSKQGLCDEVGSDDIIRLINAGRFTSDTILPNGEFWQCGDNDSGRFITITPLIDLGSSASEETDVYREAVNRPDAVITAINAFTDSKISANDNSIAEYNIIRALMGESQSSIDSTTAESDELNPKLFETIQLGNYEDAYEYKSVDTYDFEANISGEMIYSEYPDFGVSIVRSNGFFLGICWTDNGQNGNSGHTHNDKLSYELWVDNKPIVRDPGTYLYTPIPDLRNAYRSGNAHSVLHTDEEQNRYINLFSMHDDTRCGIFERELSADRVELGYKLTYRNISQVRVFRLTRSGLEIFNYSNVPFNTDYVSPHVTDGYGRLA